MAVVKITFGAGGRQLAPRGQGQPSLADVLRDIADDLTAIKSPAVTVSPPAIDLPTCIALAEELRTIIDAGGAYTLLTEKG